MCRFNGLSSLKIVPRICFYISHFIIFDFGRKISTHCSMHIQYTCLSVHGILACAVCAVARNE